MENQPIHFRDKKINSLVKSIDTLTTIKVNVMNQISNDIKNLEERLKKWNIPHFITVKDEHHEISWSSNDKRLMARIAEGVNRPLIETPFEYRHHVYTNGLIEKLLQEVNNYFKDK